MNEPTPKAKRIRATAALTLRTEITKAGGTHPVRLRITFLRQRKYYGIGIDITLELFTETQDKHKKSQKVVDARQRLDSFLSKAVSIINKLDEEEFTFEKFEQRFFQNDLEAQRNKSLQTDLHHHFETYVASLKAEGRAATAQSYYSAASSFKAFRSDLKLDQITPDLLAKYEKWMLNNGSSISTVGIYARSLRTIINQVKSKGLIKDTQYPFGRGKYIIPASRNVKKALSLAEIKLIFQYEAIPLSPEDKARDFWVFSYLTNGLNIKDIVRLKWKNIDGDKLSFIRAKTARSSKANQRAISAVLTDPAKEIIAKWGSQDRRPDSYIFEVLQTGITPLRERELVQNFTKIVNKWMRRVAAAVGIDKPVTSYFARHSYATVLKRSGAPMEYISESLGHKDLRTTESYLDSFEDDVKKQYSNALLNF
jgi:integrase